MSLAHSLLGLLSYRSATGYELKTAFNKSIHFFWNAALPQIYRTLKQMEEKGWLTVTVAHQDGKPSRKIYHVTEAGKEELRRWLEEVPEIPEPRDPMLIKIFFGHQMDPGNFISHLQRWREYHAGLLMKFDEEITPIIDQYAKMTGAIEDARYWSLTLDFGRRHAEMVINWCDQILKTIDQPKKRGRKG
jgi:PadR family transcriptional regulator, regulatory protein AphA